MSRVRCREDLHMDAGGAHDAATSICTPTNVAPFTVVCTQISVACDHGKYTLLYYE